MSNERYRYDAINSHGPLGRPAGIAGALMLNPMSAIVESHRAITLYGHMPDWGDLCVTGLLSAGLLGLSLALFRALEDAFVEEI